MDRLILKRDTLGMPSVIQAGDLVFTAGMDGHVDPITFKVKLDAADDPIEQSRNSYGQICAALRHCGSDPVNIVRLDHFTQSQSWLEERSQVRAEIFGRPAPVASTGIAAKMAGLNMLTTAAIAVTRTEDKKVLLQGRPYGMPNIAAVVQAGSFLFMSGVRATLLPASQPCEEESPAALGAQGGICFRALRSMLTELNIPHTNLLRIDYFIRDRKRLGEVHEVIERELPGARFACTGVAVPLGMRGEIEANAIVAVSAEEKEVLANGSVIRGGGLYFVGEIRPSTSASEGGAASTLRVQLFSCLEELTRRLANADSGPDRVVRLDLLLRDPNDSDSARALVREFFGAASPVLLIAGAELEGSFEVKINGIAC